MLYTAARGWSPWAPGDAIPWLALALVGHVTAFAGWWFASRDAVFDDQLQPAALGVAGAVIAVFAHVSWLLKAHQELIERRQRLWPDEAIAFAAEVDGVGGPLAGPRPAAAVVLSQAGDRMHRPDCQLVVGKGWPVVDRADARDRRPCEVCRP
jgi:hypothetical protein